MKMETVEFMVLATHNRIIYLVVINKRAHCMSQRELIACNDDDKQQLYCGNNSKNGVDYSPDEAQIRSKLLCLFL